LSALTPDQIAFYRKKYRVVPHVDPRLQHGGRRGGPAVAPPGGLTEREADALRLIALGLSEPRAAAFLGLSLSAFRGRVAAARKRLGARKITELVAICIRRELLW
jgi:DNA-binding CsgD family transcriptional regulator